MRAKFAVWVALSFFLSACNKPTGKDLERLDNLIRQELSSGTDKATVVAFLKQQEIPYDDSKDIAYYKGPRKVWGKVSQSHGITSTDYTLTFQFDDRNRLISYELKKREVGP